MGGHGRLLARQMRGAAAAASAIAGSGFDSDCAAAATAPPAGVRGSGILLLPLREVGRGLASRVGEG